MTRVTEYKDCLIVHTKNDLTYLIEGPDDLFKLMDCGGCFDDSCMEDGYKTLPSEMGLYRATVEYWFEQGYFEGYPEPGECEVDFRLTNLRSVTALTTPATVPSEPWV